MLQTTPNLSDSPAFPFQFPLWPSFPAPPTCDSGGLQSNACIAPYSATRPNPYPPVGLGLLFDGHNPFGHSSGSVTPLDGALHEELDFILNSAPLFAPDASPAPPLFATEDLHLIYSSLRDMECQTTPTPSSSTFSISDWINQSPSLPTACDASYKPSDLPLEMLSCVIKDDSYPISGSEICLADTQLFGAVTGGAAASKSAGLAALDLPLPPELLGNPYRFVGTETSEAMGQSNFHLAHAARCSPLERLVGPKCYPSLITSEPAAGKPPGPLFPKSEPELSPTSLTQVSSRTSNETVFMEGLANGPTLASHQDPYRENGTAGALVSPDTPIYNAHEGVTESDLQRRADRHRRRYPGQGLGRDWLLNYAGKINKDGEIMEDYRCYVFGCTQVNRRRDHILVHIGSHVNERPFKCRHCNMTFLRRNECKRHEAGHSGSKPFICRLCPEPAARFARQDLLTRHTKRTHSIAALERGTKRQQTSDPDRRTGEGPVRKRARMSTLRPCMFQENCF
ncbi:hypothetical protein BC834DRAFT_688993 [Gloeopeniophorella convolvens]|nr:hypothetical protein BC834DRAFT_688993 [Gloeopeniophorella convolvens]